MNFCVKNAINALFIVFLTQLKYNKIEMDFSNKSLNNLLFIFLIQFTFCSDRYIEKDMYTQADIIKELESVYFPDPYKMFHLMSDDDLYLSNTRITLFADNARWAIVFELTGYNMRAECISTELTYFGNCLSNLDKGGLNNKYTSNKKWLGNIVDCNDFKEIEVEYYFVNPLAKSIQLRGKNILIEQDYKKYESKGIHINLEGNPKKMIDFPALTRYLNSEYPELFNATDEELRLCIPPDLPKLMTINEWHHRDYYFNDSFPSEEGTRPSEYETFPMIANILVTKDTSLWQPKLKPNTHWKNWGN